MSRIYFASNRDVKHETSSKGDLFGTRFNHDGPSYFRVGWADVTFEGSDVDNDESYKIGDSKLYDEERTVRGNRDPRLGSASFFEDLREAIKNEGCDVLVYIHGFNVSFREAVLGAARLERVYNNGGPPLRVVLFSWPSNGRVAPAWNYFSDRHDAQSSGLAMARALDKLLNFIRNVMQEDDRALRVAAEEGREIGPDELQQCGRCLHLIAHSMGNRALRFALQEYLVLRGRAVSKVFENIFLAAADVDDDALEKDAELAPLVRIAEKVHVYHASNDWVLEISDKFKPNPDRLGSRGPKNWDAVPEGFFSIDCRAVTEGRLKELGHQHYRRSPEVIADIQATLRGEDQEGRPNRKVLIDGRHWRLEEG